jgi:hypothetical protein
MINKVDGECPVSDKLSEMGHERRARVGDARHGQGSVENLAVVFSKRAAADLF